MRGEQDLIRTLRTAAGQVEPVDLARGVAARRRSRRVRQRVRMTLAAAAVVAVAGGTTAALTGEARRAEPAATVSPSGPSGPSGPSPSRPRPVDEVWPRAIAKVPARTAAGVRIVPVAALSPTEVLLFVPAPAKGKESRLDVYDLTRRATKGALAHIPPIKGADGPAGIAVGPRHVAWHGGTDQSTTFWVAPRTGGSATRVAEFSGRVTDFDLAGDSLVWSSDKGVHRVPLSGGTPEPLPGSAGFRLTSWPWAEHVGRAAFANTDRVVNLETGRTYDVQVPEGTQYLRCGPRWCAGDLNGRLLVQHVDGTGRRVLSGLRLYSVRQPYVGRYVLAGLAGPADRTDPEPGDPLALLYDLDTGAAVGLGEHTPGTLGTPLTSTLLSDIPSMSVLYWDQDAQPPEKCSSRKCPTMVLGKKEWTVLNLLALT
ncbi:hypothetical protein [Nonomuraea sp. NPDC050783]|uniref:hypothetical protein n=1 Tax=Nonomuraea sp. NPDC050783 TaxID=3154634 RepID=UPI003466445C